MWLVKIWLIFVGRGGNFEFLRGLRLMGNSPEICRRHYADLIPETMVDSVEFVQIDNRTKKVSE